MAGKLIVIEGADGTGKATQAELLLKWLKKMGQKAVTMDFPAYKTPAGREIKAYLKGKYGNPIKVDPYFAASFYIIDRFNAKTKLKLLLQKNDFVVLDRYVCSNLAHQAIKIKNKNERLRFIDWDERLEYQQLELPKPDMVIVLRVDYQTSQQLIQNKDKDIHESDVEYQRKVRLAYENLLKQKKEWLAIDCANKKGGILNRSAIRAKIQKAIKKSFKI